MRGASVVVVVVVSGCSPADADGPATAIRVDPKADQLLRSMSRSIGTMRSFQFDAEHVLEVVTHDGQKLQFVAQSRVSVERPNKLRSDRIGPVADLSFFYDGRHLTIYGRRSELYAIAEAPGNIDGAIDFARDRLGIDAPAADLFYANPYPGLMADVISGIYLADEPVGDHMCHHLAYRGHDADWQIWIEDSSRALPCRYEITTKNVLDDPDFSVSFSNWVVEPMISQSTFEFTPPPDATQIEFLHLHQPAEKARTP
jgi:hypothetical protein